MTDQVRSLLLRKQRLAHVGGRECFRERRTQAWEVAHKRAEKILELLAESKSLLFRPLFPRIPKQLVLHGREKTIVRVVCWVCDSERRAACLH